MTTLSPLQGKYPDLAPPSHPRRSEFLSVCGALGMVVALSLAALAGAPRAAAFTEPLVMSAPISPFTVQRLASLPRHPWLAGHRGVDLVSGVRPVTSPASGVVSFVGFVVDRRVLSIRHDRGLVSSFEPIDSNLSVGDHVSRGQTLGTVADVPHHCRQVACIHWGLRLDGEYVDPLDYLEGFGAVRLLPATSG